MSSAPDIKNLRAEDFQPFLNQIFMARCDDHELELELVSCETMEQWQLDGSRTPFSLIFQSKKPSTLQQGCYAIHGQEMGTMTLFLVPIAVGQYQVIFN